MKRSDLTGKEFGRFTVLRFSHSEVNKAYWLCKCLCGNEKVVRSISLTSGHARSCGCLRREKESKEGTAFNCLFAQYRCDAERRGIEFQLTREQFRSLTSTQCYYTGRRPSQHIKSKSGKDVYLYNGIDRIDSTQGYTIDNCVPCCAEVNRMKGTLTKEEFTLLCRAVVQIADGSRVLSSVGAEKQQWV